MSKKSERVKKHKAWRSLVLERDKCCQICGRTDGRLNAHHLLPKQYKELRYDIDNGMILCWQHHKAGKFSPHQNPIWFYKWLETNRPEVLSWILARLN